MPKIVDLITKQFLPVLFLLTVLLVFPGYSQSEGAVIVRPGAPGQPTKQLPLSTKASLPELSAKDVEFMQGMIMHHSQAVEMTSLIKTRTDNKEIRLLGARISQSQTDEMEFMARWLGLRKQPVEMQMRASPGSHAYGSHSSDDHMVMPGMLSQGQMEDLRLARGKEFDRLFLLGMIQHHEGALVMVKELFDTAGAGQDAELFNFATDVDTGQRTEINIMKLLLGEKP